MVECPNCGAIVQDGSTSCPSCGAPLNQNPSGYNQQNQYGQQPVYGQAPQQAPYGQPYNPGYNYGPQYVAPVSTGGYVAWAIVTLLLCTIPGIVAIVYATRINKCSSVEEQQKTIQTTKTWCLVGTILGGLSVILSIVGNLINA